MSSIDPRQSRDLDQFHDAYLRPLAETPNQASDDDAGSSYFVKRTHPRLRRQDFELQLGDWNQAASTLERAWAGTRLHALAKPLMKLAPEFQKVEERAEVSSFVYEMF